MLTSDQVQANSFDMLQIPHKNAFPPEQVQALKSFYKAFSKVLMEEKKIVISHHFFNRQLIAGCFVLGISAACALSIYEILAGPVLKWSFPLDPLPAIPLFPIIPLSCFAKKMNKGVEKAFIEDTLYLEESKDLLKRMLVNCPSIITKEKLNEISRIKNFKILPKTHVEERKLTDNSPEASLKYFLRYDRHDIHIFLNEVLRELKEDKEIIDIKWDEYSNQNTTNTSENSDEYSNQNTINTSENSDEYSDQNTTNSSGNSYFNLLAFFRDNSAKRPSLSSMEAGL